MSLRRNLVVLDSKCSAKILRNLRSKNLESLRTLKDHYASEEDVSRNETDTWRHKVDTLTDKLQKTRKELDAVKHQRDKATERAKEARSQEDEYFEENSRLQQQDDTLNAKLNDLSAAANRSKA